MKKIFIILIISLMLMFSLIGCSGTTQLSEDDIHSKPSYSMFIKLESASYYDIVYHKDTKVMYAISRGGYNQGTFTVLLNADGTPMLYESN